MRLPRHERYKESGIAWLGKVPEHWGLNLGRRLFAEKREQSLESDEQLSATQKYGVIPQTLFMEMEDQKVVLALRGLDAFKHVEANDFIISLRSFQGGIEKSHYQGCVSTAYTVLRATDLIAPDYWKYLFKSDSYISVLRSVTDGIREGKSISYDQFASVALPIPLLEEQEQIAKFLDREVAKIDALIDEQRRLIALLKEKRQAVISHTVTKGLNPSAPMKDSGVDWFDSIPSHWSIKRLGQISSIVRGGSPRPAGDSRYFNGSFVPWITVGEITKDAVMFLWETETMLTEEGAKLSRLIDSGTLVLTNSGATLGVPKILKITGCANDGVLAFLNLHSEIDQKFLFYFLNMLTEPLRERIKQGSGQPNLNTSIVGALPLPIPPLKEQKILVTHLEKLSASYASLEQQAFGLIDLLQERRSALISAAVTGKINVTTQIAKPVRSTWSAGFARQVLAAETLSRCNGSSMGRIKLQKLIHLCEYHAQLDEVRGTYSRQAAGPFAPQVMEDVREGLLQQRWFEEYKDGDRYRYRPLEEAGGHQHYLPHWEDKQARIDQVLNLLGGELTQKCEIASTLYAAWNDLLIDGKNPTDAEIIHEASSAESWHESKEKIAAEKWRESLKWMRAKGLVAVGYGTHTTHQPDLFTREGHEPA
jgi:type I restriction enzyme S subunit